MTIIHPNMEVHAAFRTRDPAPELPELRGMAFIDHGVSKYHADAQSEIRVRLHEAGPERVIRALQDARVRVSRCSLTPHYRPEFWDAPPDDCAGALLAADGHVALRDANLYRRVVPLPEPLYTIGRPEADSEHSRYKPHVLRAGGIPIVSDELLLILRELGADGETGKITYRGSNKAAYDMVQQGFCRFLPQPTYDMPCSGGIEFLPEAVPDDFGICSMLRSPAALPEQVPVVPGNLAEERWYDIALALGRCVALRQGRRRVLLVPVFRRGGMTHQWVSIFQAAIEALRA
jgi:hypothetical protein